MINRYKIILKSGAIIEFKGEKSPMSFKTTSYYEGEDGTRYTIDDSEVAAIIKYD